MKVSFEDRSDLWGEAPAGEIGYIDGCIDQLAERLHIAVLIDDGAEFFLLSHPDVGLVSIVWEPEAQSKDRCSVVTRADVDRVALLRLLHLKFGKDTNVVVYPDECQII